MSRDLAADYKTNAINKALAEMYCSGSKYRDRNKLLKEKSNS